MRNVRVPFTLLILSILGLIAIDPSFSFKESQSKNSVYVAPPKGIEHFSLGFENLVASLLWLRVAQDLDYCHSTLEKASNLEVDLDQILEKKLSPSRCHEGWVYQMIDRVTDLNPYFYHAYSNGGLALSILVDDRVGAAKIFEKGLRVFPEKYNLTSRAAYHYIYEMQKPKRAAEILILTQNNGGPKWMASLAARLFDRAGAPEFGIAVLKDFLSKNPEGKAADRARMRLRELSKKVEVGG